MIYFILKSVEKCSCKVVARLPMFQQRIALKYDNLQVNLAQHAHAWHRKCKKYVSDQSLWYIRPSSNIVGSKVGSGKFRGLKHDFSEKSEETVSGPPFSNLHGLNPFLSNISLLGNKLTLLAGYPFWPGTQILPCRVFLSTWLKSTHIELDHVHRHSEKRTFVKIAESFL